jgi:hypothetical protein
MFHSPSEVRPLLIRKSWKELANHLVAIEKRSDPQFSLDDIWGLNKDMLVDSILVARFGHYACRNLPTIKPSFDATLEE